MSDTAPTPLALYLAENDVPCPNPKCGFNLRGLRDATCPECREPLSLTIRRPEALWYVRKWLVATVAIGLVSYLIALAVSYLVASIASFYLGPLPVDRTASILVSFAIAIGLGGSLLRYLVASRRGDRRALPRLLVSFLLAMLVQFMLVAAIAIDIVL